MNGRILRLLHREMFDRAIGGLRLRNFVICLVGVACVQLQCGLSSWALDFSTRLALRVFSRTLMPLGWLLIAFFSSSGKMSYFRTVADFAKIERGWKIGSNIFLEFYFGKKTHIGLTLHKKILLPVTACVLLRYEFSRFVSCLPLWKIVT